MTAPPDSEYLRFEQVATPTRKTRVIAVWSKRAEDDQLGTLAYYTPWRRYVFTPVNAWSIFDVKCLKDIVAYLEHLEAERRTDHAGRQESSARAAGDRPQG